MAFYNDWFKKKENLTSSSFTEDLDGFIVFIFEKCKKKELLKAITKRTKEIQKGDEAYKKKYLSGLYLLFEHYLLSNHLIKPLEVDKFRKQIKQKFPHLSESRNFNIIYLDLQERKYVLSALFVKKVLKRSQKFFGSSTDNYLQKSFEKLRVNVEEIFKHKIKASIAMQASLNSYAHEMFDKMSEKLGEDLITNYYRNSYDEIANNFQVLDGFTAILNLFPSKILDEKQISLLNSEELSSLLLEKIGSIQYANQLLKIEVKERKATQEKLRLKERRINRLNEKLEKNVDELNFANSELESFSYSVGHDLRAPLRAINGFAKILENDYATELDDEGKRLLGVITHNSNKMGSLIDGLLTYSQLSRKELVLNNMNTANVIHEYMYENKIAEEQLNIKKLHNMNADKMLMKIVFANLINNAIKFSSKEKISKIEIGSKENGKYMEYYVRDNGVGLDMKYVHKIYGVFNKLHPESEFSGTGVGLAIVEKIIAKHKGKLWAESKINEGATFYFSIPK